MKKIRVTIKTVATLGLAAMLTVSSIPAAAFAEEVTEPEAGIEISEEMPENGEETGNPASGITEESTEEAIEDAAGEAESPTFDETKVIDGIKINVSADEGVLPEDAELSVKKAGKAEEAEAMEAVDEERPEDRQVAASYTFDIKILDKDGNEIQPSDESTVKVSFTLDEVSDSNL